MTGKGNLRPFTKENASEMGRRGGQISAKKRKDFQHMSHALRYIMLQGMSLPEDLEGMVPKKMGKELSVQDVLLLEQVKKALGGDTRALSFLRDTMGEAPQHNTILMDDLQEVDLGYGLGSLPMISSGQAYDEEDGEYVEDGEDSEKEIVLSMGEAALRFIISKGFLEDLILWEDGEERKESSPILEASILDLLEENGAREILGRLGRT